MARQLMRTLDGSGGGSSGTMHTFWCNDGVVSRLSPPLWRKRCLALLGSSWSDRGTSPVRSDVPALIEAGEFDPRTAPSRARFLAAGFPRSHVVITPWHGHEKQPDCTMRIASRFFDEPGRAPDLACVDSIPPIEFVSGVTPVPWLGRSVARIVERPPLLAFPGAAALLLLAPPLGLPLRRWRRRRSGRPGTPPVGSAAVLALALIGLVALIATAAAVFAGQQRHFFIPMIGVTREWAWVLALPWLLLAITPVTLILARGGHRGGEPVPAILRWSAFAGVALLLALWGCNLLA